MMRLKSFLFKIAFEVFLIKIGLISRTLDIFGIKHFFLISDDIVFPNGKTNIAICKNVPELDKFNNDGLFVLLHHICFLCNLVRTNKYDLTIKDIFNKYVEAGLAEAEENNDSGI